jgi:hypothetical protein
MRPFNEPMDFTDVITCPKWQHLTDASNYFHNDLYFFNYSSVGIIGPSCTVGWSGGHGLAITGIGSEGGVIISAYFKLGGVIVSACYKLGCEIISACLIIVYCIIGCYIIGYCIIGCCIIGYYYGVSEISEWFSWLSLSE